MCLFIINVHTKSQYSGFWCCLLGLASLNFRAHILNPLVQNVEMIGWSRSRWTWYYFINLTFFQCCLCNFFPLELVQRNSTSPRVDIDFFVALIGIFSECFTWSCFSVVTFYIHDCSHHRSIYLLHFHTKWVCISFNLIFCRYMLCTSIKKNDASCNLCQWNQNIK